MGSLTSLILFQILWIHNPAFASSPVMTHTSMDVGNIISIIIPESPDTTINVDQLTADFRRQLERIHKQSRVNKLEHGLVTLKNVLPEMSREEKKKSLPLIRRVLQTRRILSPKNSTKESSRKKMQRNKNTRRSPTKNTTTNSTNNTANHEKQSKSTNNSRVKPTQKKPQKPVKKQKVVKTPKAYVIEDSPLVKMEHMGNDNFNQEEYLITKENYHQPNWKNQDEQQMASMVEINQSDRHSDISESVDFDRNEEGPRQSWDRDINRPNRRASQFPCSGGDDESKVRSTKDIHGFNIARELKTNDCDKGIDADGKPITCHKESDAISMGMSGGDETRVFNYPMEVAYSGDDDDEYKGYERVLHNPQLSLDQINSTAFDNGPAAGGENSLTKRKVHVDQTMENGGIMSINREAFRPEVKTSEFYELNEKRRNFMIDDQVAGRAAYSGNLEAIPRVGRQFVDFDNKNFEIRIQRSVDNHLMKGMTMKPRYQGDLHRGMYSQVDYGKIQEKIMKSQKGRVKKMKKPWKAYPRSLDKYLVG